MLLTCCFFVPHCISLWQSAALSWAALLCDHPPVAHLRDYKTCPPRSVIITPAAFPLLTIILRPCCLMCIFVIFICLAQLRDIWGFDVLWRHLCVVACFLGWHTPTGHHELQSPCGVPVPCTLFLRHRWSHSCTTKPLQVLRAPRYLPSKVPRDHRLEVLPLLRLSPCNVFFGTNAQGVSSEDLTWRNIRLCIVLHVMPHW